VTALVADASVIIKWFVEEDFSKQSLRMRDDYVDQKVRIVVPSLARFEILNALRYSGGFGLVDLLEVARSLDSYQLVELPLGDGDSQETVELAMSLGITVFDASYVAIGKLKGLQVYTADEGLLRKTEKLDFVCHIKEYAGAKG
jgi:predicted nucleic acid-binding protein